MTERDYIRVRDVMNPNIQTIDGLATIEQAILHMKKHRHGALIIERRDDRDEYGFVTVQEIARQVIEPDRSPDRVSVYEIMEKPVLTVHGNMNIRYAIRLLERLGESRALVIDSGKAVGIVTILDMVLKYMDHYHFERSENGDG